MQPVESQLKFVKYQVEKMAFCANDSYVCDPAQSIKLKPEFTRVIKKIGEDEYELFLGVAIKQEKEDEELPFSLEVVVKGVFLLKGIENQKERIKVNAAAILFPYMRTTVSMLMSLANIEPLFLPAMNVTRIFEEQEKQSREEKTEP